MEKTENFTLALLSLCERQGEPTGQSAALYFKNTIKRYWTFDEAAISEGDRNQIKRSIVKVSLASPVQIQVQLCEAISFIADSDFPEKWDFLISTLTSNLSPTDWNMNNGVLLIVHSIFKRWRSQFRSDALFREIKLVLGQFCPTYLELFKAADIHAQTNISNPIVLNQIMPTILLLCKIYQSLVCQDLPGNSLLLNVL